MHPLVPMSPLSPRRRYALLGALALLLPSAAGVAGAQEPPVTEVPAGSDGTAPADTVLEEVEEDASGDDVRPFLRVPGVRLRALGYGGIPLDADIIERTTAELPGDPRERVVEISTRLDLAPPQLEALEAAEEVLAGAVADLGPDVEALREDVAVASRLAEGTRGRVVDAERRASTLAGALEDHRERMVEVAVAAYIRPPDADALDKVLQGAAAATEDLTAGVLFSAKAENDGLVRDELEVARALAVERLRRDAEVAAYAAERVVAGQAALAEVEARREAHEEALAMVAGARAALERALPELQADMDRTIEETWGALDLLVAGPGVDGAVIVDVAGIRVHAAIAPKLQAMLAAARADGVPLGGWGYRSTQQQIQLRIAHCGPTPEDIWLKPSSQCSPPTARPGASMHERGLAVDFHLAGRSISTRDSPGYQWLAANAATFGFFNLPSEPWHWSVNAQ